MLTDRQEKNLRLLFDPSSVPPGRRVSAADRAAGAALLGEVDRLRDERAADGEALFSGAGRCAALEVDVGRLTAERDEARAAAGEVGS